MIANVIRSKYFFRHTVLFLAAQECLLSAQTNKPLAPPRGSPGISRRAQGPLRQAPAYDNNRRIDIELDSDLATNFVMAKIVTGKDISEQIAIVVKQLSASVTET